jgi:iron complex outermembrane receptor protein
MKARYKISCAVAAILTGCSGVAVAADDAGSTATSVQEITVTAQRRSENIQNVPFTVQAFSGEAISKLNVTSIEEILRFTPNVVYSAPGAGQGQIFMRGLSTGRAGEQSYATVGNFPNVAVYLDEQSMQFPGRSPDIFLADMQRVEVLEGPQGTLFGGGAEAGALRYITNKPKMNVYEGSVSGLYGYTQHGDANWNGTAVINLPIVTDKLAVRAVVYDDRQGGYIDNVPSTFTRNEQLDNNTYIGVRPTGGVCPDGGAPNPNTGFCLPAHTTQANNYSIAKKAQNPVTTDGARAEVLWNITPDWDLLISESFQNLDAEGLSTAYPTGSDFQKLGPWQVTSFVPTYNRDNYENTAWTLNGKIANLSVIYTGAYTDRHVVQQNDYTNYSRTLYGQYYECTGGNNSGFGAGSAHGPAVPATCYSPVTFWHDKVHSTHMSHEARISTPSDWRLRGVAGVFYEQQRIYDVMDFDYKTIPSCNNPATPAGIICVGNDAPAPGSTANNPGIKGDMVGYGDDTQRGYNQTAFFGQVDFDIIPNVLTVTAGTRHFQYDEYEKGSIYHTATNCASVSTGTPPATPLICPFKANIDAEGSVDVNDPAAVIAASKLSIAGPGLKASYSGYKSHFGVEYKPFKDLMFYYTYSEGFRPGGFNRYPEIKAPYTAGGSDNQFVKPVSYAPDSLKNNEIGVKSELFDRRLQLNITAYDMKWLDSQIALYQPCCLGNSTFTTNGASYEVKGVELQFVAHAMEGLTVQGSASFNDNKQINSPCLTSNAPGSPTLGQCITQVKGQPYPNPFGVKGGVSAFSPKFKGNLSVRYDWTIDAYKPFVSLNGDYTSDQYNEPENYIAGDQPSQIVPTTTYLRYKIPAYGTIGGSIGFTRDTLMVELIGSNLLNSDSITFASSGQFIKAVDPLRPRVINLKITKSF